MQESINKAIEKLQALPKEVPITIISHFDTDGITSAAIFSRALQRSGFRFSLKILRSLDSEFISSLPETNPLIFLDLASNSLSDLAKKSCPIFILDHHEIIQTIPKNITIVNPTLSNRQICSAAICYLFAKTLSPQNKDLATLAVIGMVGDNHEKNLCKEYDEIIKESETTIKKGLLLYPSTRPIDRVLEYSSSLYIPNVTGSYSGVLGLLRDAGIQKSGNQYKALYELSQEEMSNLVTTITLHLPDKSKTEELIGNLYLVKFFNKLEDARELSALINSCSRMDHPETALGFCLGNLKMKQKAEKTYINYKQNLVSALKFVEETDKISGKNYTIINAQDKVKDTIIGTVASIISHSNTYNKGTIIIALAYNQDKIKVSARISGKSERNVREVLSKVVIPLGGEVGGHPGAAGCLISKEKESIFISELQKTLETETPKTN
jgi:single-stranded-DNA-specific exonuclease